MGRREGRGLPLSDEMKKLICGRKKWLLLCSVLQEGRLRRIESRDRERKEGRKELGNGKEKRIEEVKNHLRASQVRKTEQHV